MIQNNADLYTEIEDLAKVLDIAGEREKATELRNALVISTLPGEILGEMRLLLRRICMSRNYRNLEVKAKVDNSLRYINSVMGP